MTAASIPLRVIVDEPRPGAWNMALDEALLASAATGGTTLRFYQWSEPTLSLGYFQRNEDRAEHLPSAGCALVRRTTGGGAILHDRELTYSFTSPLAERFADPLSLYRTFHESLVEEFRSLGIAAETCDGRGTLGQAEPFLCFARRSAGDVLVQGGKVAGSAQRRHRSAVLMHGSILLRQSSHAPELPGLLELAQVQLAPQDLLEHWLRRLSARLGVVPFWAAADPNELRRADELRSAKFGNSGWSERR